MGLDIAYITRMLCKYLRNPGVSYWKTAKSVSGVYREQKTAFKYLRSGQLEIIRYTDSDFVGC